MQPHGASAIILSGVVHRSIRHVIESFRSNLLGPLNELGEVDIYFHTWDVATVNNPRAGEKSVNINVEDVLKYLPEAQGVVDSQDAFDQGIDWARVFAQNPMRYHTNNEEGAQITMQNLLRAVHSVERAWECFRKTKARTYKRVVSTRMDLRFIEKLKVPAELIDGDKESPQACAKVWVPGFHIFGGVNDRFVIGREEEIGVWSQRTAHVDKWLVDPGSENSERVLLQWLTKNGISPISMDFVFQRVRADGKTAAGDLKLRV